MKILDIIEGYFTLKYLMKKGFVEDDGISFGSFMKLIEGAEKNIMNKEVAVDENK